MRTGCDEIDVGPFRSDGAVGAKWPAAPDYVDLRDVGNFDHQLLDIYKKLVEFAAKEQ